MMTQDDWALLSAIANNPTRLAATCRALAIGGVVAALAACAESVDPVAPRTPAAEAALAPTNVAATEQTEDAIDRLLPALEKDAAAPVGNALAALDAKLRDPRATAAAKDRAAATVQNVLAQFTDPARGDAADLDAMRLEIEAIRASLR